MIRPSTVVGNFDCVWKVSSSAVQCIKGIQEGTVDKKVLISHSHVAAETNVEKLILKKNKKSVVLSENVVITDYSSAFMSLSDQGLWGYCGCHGNCIIHGPVGSYNHTGMDQDRGWRVIFMCFSTSLSNHLVKTGLSATGLLAWGLVMLLASGTGMIVTDLRQVGTKDLWQRLVQNVSK